jgi:hypothetical protein
LIPLGFDAIKTPEFSQNRSFYRFWLNFLNNESDNSIICSIFALKLGVIMEATVVSQDVSVVDALLTIYRQQNESVRRDFLLRVRQEDSLLDMPGMRTREEMMQVSRERMRDIIAGREQTLSHEEAMKMVDNAIAETA